MLVRSLQFQALTDVFHPPLGPPTPTPPPRVAPTPTGRINVTTGWWKFVKAAGFERNDDIKVQHLPGPVLLVTRISRAGGQRAAPARAPKNGAKARGRAGASPQQPSRRQGKRPRDALAAPQGSRALAEAGARRRLQPGKQAGQQPQHERQQGIVAPPLPGGPPGLHPDESPYICHTPTTDGDEQEAAEERWERQQRGQRGQGQREEQHAEEQHEERFARAEQRRGLHAAPREARSAPTEDEEAPAQRDGGGSSEGSDEEHAAVARPGKRRRAAPSGMAAAAAAVVPSAEPSPKVPAAAEARQSDAQLAAAAADLVGRDVVLVSACCCTARHRCRRLSGSLAPAIRLERPQLQGCPHACVPA